jgi:hypothetical protein
LTTAAAMAAAREAGRFTDWYSSDAITAFTARIVRAVEAAQRQTAAVTDAYLSRVFSVLTGRPTRRLGPVDIGGLRVGVTHQGAYGRLADQYRFEVSRGTLTPIARELVLERARVLAETDVDLAFRAQVDGYARSDGFKELLGWRRVIHPELSAGGSCGLCIAASERVYGRFELLPLHARCKCDVLPIVGDEDPGMRLNRADLKALYARAGSTSAGELKRTRYRVEQHAELGPVLVDASHHFKGDKRA